jgi:hypothetical protein
MTSSSFVVVILVAVVTFVSLCKRCRGDAGPLRSA